MPRHVTFGPGPTPRLHRALPAATAAALTLVLSSCGGSTPGDTPASPPASAPSTAPSAPDTASATSSPSTTATPSETGTTTAGSFADIDGTWCQADDASTCLTIALPSVTTPPGSTDYVYPSEDPTGDPSTWTYTDMAPRADGCYETFADGYPPMSGAELVYCPAGSVPTDVNDLVGDSTVDRVFVTQETDATPFYRAEG